MTSIARQPASTTSRAPFLAMVRSMTRPGLALVRRAERSIRSAATKAQLGRDPETEIGRWTGARI